MRKQTTYTHTHSFTSSQIYSAAIICIWLARRRSAKMRRALTIESAPMNHRCVPVGSSLPLGGRTLNWNIKINALTKGISMHISRQCAAPSFWHKPIDPSPRPLSIDLVVGGSVPFWRGSIVYIWCVLWCWWRSANARARIILCLMCPPHRALILLASMTRWCVVLRPPSRSVASWSRRRTNTHTDYGTYRLWWWSSVIRRIFIIYTGWALKWSFVLGCGFSAKWSGGRSVVYGILNRVFVNYCWVTSYKGHKCVRVCVFESSLIPNECYGITSGVFVSLSRQRGPLWSRATQSALTQIQGKNTFEPARMKYI